MRLPPCCLKCGGEPFVPGTLERCTCKRGMWFRFHPDYEPPRKHQNQFLTHEPLPARVWAHRPGLSLEEMLEASNERKYSKRERQEMADKVQLETNIWQEIALRYTDGKNLQNEYGESVMFSLADGRVLFVPVLAAEKIRALGLNPGEPLDIRKAEVKNGGGKSRIEWQVKRVDPPVGEQSNGTLAIRKETASTSPGSAVSPIATGATQPPVPNGNNNTANGKSSNSGNSGNLPESPFEHSGQSLLLSQTTNMLVDVLARCKSYSTRYNGLIGADDVRSIMLSAYINLSKGGKQ